MTKLFITSNIWIVLFISPLLSQPVISASLPPNSNSNSNQSSGSSSQGIINPDTLSHPVNPDSTSTTDVLDNRTPVTDDSCCSLESRQKCCCTCSHCNTCTYCANKEGSCGDLCKGFGRYFADDLFCGSCWGYSLDEIQRIEEDPDNHCSCCYCKCATNSGPNKVPANHWYRSVHSCYNNCSWRPCFWCGWCPCVLGTFVYSLVTWVLVNGLVNVAVGEKFFGCEKNGCCCGCCNDDGKNNSAAVTRSRGDGSAPGEVGSDANEE